VDRDLLVKRLETDLLGPLVEDEVLVDTRPTDVYLTGILWPRDSRIGAEENDRLDSAGTSTGGEDDTEGAGEEVPLAGLMRPCAAGLSFALTEGSDVSVHVKLRFALYELEERDSETAADGGASSIVGSSAPHDAAADKTIGEDGGGASGNRKVRKRERHWRRRFFEIQRDNLCVPKRANERHAVRCDGLPDGVSLHVRASDGAAGMRLVTLTIVNEMKPETETKTATEQKTMFQVGLTIKPAGSCRLVPKPDALRAGDDEERAAALLFRDSRAFAAGHTCSAEWTPGPDGASALQVATTWLPRYEVPKVQAGGHAVFDTLRTDPEARTLEAAWLGSADTTQLEAALHRLVHAYDTWIDGEKKRVNGLAPKHQASARGNLARCEEVRDRIRRGVERLALDELLRVSFQLANRAIQLQHEWNPERKGRGPLIWRPFQLGFVLLAAASVCDDCDPDRGVMDLLWFPTGGGKTEAYLALIAMLAFYRRLSSDKPDERSGVAAVMRYTLRLLTTQQFVRASALMLACEAIRRSKTRSLDWSLRLGARPFSIGLWLGGEATPNRYEDAERAISGDRDKASPEQLVECPCCHGKLVWGANRNDKRIEVRCYNNSCEVGIGGVTPLPVWTVDDDVYQQRPTLLIGTIDKFAQLPRRKEAYTLFGMGSKDSPDLIIQDELHLISGPLGTIASVYETAFDWLISRDGRRAKIVGSTATIRRAAEQTRALFHRAATQFPPPGLDHYDSGFAVLDDGSPGRLYVGVTTAGRSAKFTLQAVTGCLLQSAHGELHDLECRDPYATLVAYFNSLRELGGALVLMQDDVKDSIRLYGNRHDETLRPADNIEELTSRRTQEEVRDMLAKLATRATEDGCVDAVLATNMVSVGVDVPRLGLMLVNGQPKTRSEYIQATSRVGRDKAPGLVVSLLNNAKPRDRSHYETFSSWHQSLYRDVEATSVTPFASRARDRALHAALATMLRHGVDGMRESPKLSETQIEAAEKVVDEIVSRAAAIDPSETRVRRELKRRLIDWEARQPGIWWDDHKPRQTLLQSAERAAALRALGRGIGDAWPTMNNMRSVEPAVSFRLAEGLKRLDEETDDEES
jgi:hypothetical protein